MISTRATGALASGLRILGLMLALAAGPGRAAEAPIKGTGGTFPAKVYLQWAEQYARDTGFAITYTLANSSVGVSSIIARTVDFGATDVPLSTATLEKEKLVQFPTLVGGVVPVVNLPGLHGSLRLNAEVLAAIFAGQVPRWNDKAIAALNPGLSLPDLHITRVVRAESSGTSQVFVSYLKHAAPAPAKDIELKGNLAVWPGSTVGVEGSGHMAESVKGTPGAIGYISSDYVRRESLQSVSLRNRHGEWVEASTEAYLAAVRAGGLFKTGLEAAPLIDIEGMGVWPIVTATYIVVPRTPPSAERASRMLNFFFRAFQMGDKAVAGTGFVPLPIATQARIAALLSSFHTPDGQLVPVMGLSGGPAGTAGSH
jgi:phosphate transport system substrate-binding protein